LDGTYRPWRRLPCTSEDEATLNEDEGGYFEPSADWAKGSDWAMLLFIPALAFFVWRKRRHRLLRQQSGVVPAPAGQPQELQAMRALQPMQSLQPIQVQAQVVQALPMQVKQKQGQPMMQMVQAPVATPVASSGGDHAETIFKLKQLFDAGAITAEEFEQQKTRHLAQM
jgi:hypothetical protein